jgi:asparagine synthetase B (glutamine-hydrolysing)
MRRRRHTFQNVVLFSGGVDSMLIAIFLHLNIHLSLPIFLINTTFVDERCKAKDRISGLLGFEDLKRVYSERNFVFIENDVTREDYSSHIGRIRKLVYPKAKPMDVGIGSCLYFGGLKAREFSKVVFLGCGADELFGGYNKHKNCDDIRKHLNDDIKEIWNANLGRDDRVLSNNNIEPRFPFLDRDLVRRSVEIPGTYLIKKIEGTLVNKYILRKILRTLGFERASLVEKKAMQYGSGIYKWEKNRWL